MDFEPGTTSTESNDRDGSVSHDGAHATACAAANSPQGQDRPARGPDRRGEKRVNRRTGLDRRIERPETAGYDGVERRAAEDRRNTLERRRGPGRRLCDDRKAAEEGEMTAYQFEFVQAIQTYKKVNKKMYPTFTELLEILLQLGYRKVLKRTIRIEAPEPRLFDAA
ncbi:MAG TPA: hypothetical protein VG326_21160 [Tepidisphaeraceae bacterium]|jgi:hypothetical protein|nr:hypothetical protein [Tepidisphaeraceae bacterium]